MNGGKCSHPNTSCHCEDYWSGKQCEIGNTSIATKLYIIIINLQQCVKITSVKMEEVACILTLTVHVFLDGVEISVKKVGSLVLQMAHVHLLYQ